MFFDIYFSVSQGFAVDFPFVKFNISTPALVLALVAVVTLKVAKVIKSRKSDKPAVPAWDETPSLFSTDRFAWDE